MAKSFEISDSSDQSTRPPLAEWLNRIRDLEARGQLVAAYDESCRGLGEFPNDLSLRHRAVLNLARSGATGYARQMFAELNLGQSENEDVAALEARLVKDDALAKRGAARAAIAVQAAALYEQIYRRTGGYYPGINAATMHLLGGNHQRATALAQEVLARLDALPFDSADAYYRSATRAEGLLLLGRDEIPAALEKTAALARDHAAMASTRRQLRIICDIFGYDPDVLEVLTPPTVIHFCGHRISPSNALERFPASMEDLVRNAVDERVRELRVGFGYGSLASGADIIVAEILLVLGAELHVVLPFGVPDFKTVSVNDSGARWVERFDACLARASSVTFATQGTFLGDATIFRYASSLAMGLAVMRSRWLDADLEQIAVWDGRPSAGPGGTADDVGFWRGLGNRTHVVDPTTATLAKPLTPDAAAAATVDPRPPRAIMFGDVRGFSRLDDAQVIRFLDHVMVGISRVLDEYGNAVLYRNTWGDGLYLILEDADVAAECALDLQEAVAKVPLAQVGLPESLALRIGGHFGPVWDREDPVLHHRSFFGAHVSRAARIEPVTIPGSVFVSEPFAARLALLKPDFRFEYVGERQAAKGFGAMRMYLLTRRTAVDPTA